VNGSAEEDVVRMPDELDWVRWQLDRLAAARLLGGLAPPLAAEYERLVRREWRLIQADNRAANRSAN
jgi:hypothetical protein